MGRKSNFNAETGIKAINEFRVKKNGESFSKEELIAVFKENGIPANNEFWKDFVKSKLIKRVYDNIYTFTSDKPIYYLALDKIYREHRAKSRKYNNNWAKKKKNKEKPVEEIKDELTQEEIPVEEVEGIDNECLEALEKFSIEFLKELGYQILRPAATVYERV